MIFTSSRLRTHNKKSSSIKYSIFMLHSSSTIEGVDGRGHRVVACIMSSPPDTSTARSLFLSYSKLVELELHVSLIKTNSPLLSLAVDRARL